MSSGCKRQVGAENVGVTPALTILDFLPELANSLAAYWFIWLFCEGVDLFNDELSPSDTEMGMCLLTGVDPEVLIF